MNCCENIIEKIEEQTFKNGTIHLRRTCTSCGKFLGYKQKDLDIETSKIWFGKYKGMLVKDLPEEYLRWLLTSFTIKENLRNLIDVVLNQN